MQKSSKLFLSLLVISGMTMNACSPAIEEMDDDMDEETHDTEVVEVEDHDDSDDSDDDEDESHDDDDSDDMDTEDPVDSEVPAEVEETVTEDEPAVVEEEPEEVSASDYSDGTYSATGSYQSPAGSESIAVSLTLEDDIVTSVTVSSHAENDTSVQFQNKFIGGVSSQVIGMDLDQLSVGNVAGSSLTPKGFNSAVASIKAQAAS
jgi:uncharacterized protein with FMN-binding domain